MKLTDLYTIEEYSNFVQKHPGTVLYFSTPECNVCKILKPKLMEILEEEFPELKFAYINCNEAKELAAQNQIFAVPTILFLFDGKETLRKSRNINLPILKEELNRPYSLFYD
ncbi:thioredoxin C-1 [bacterium BMS3Abin04]|nr:thioredoxin C-1 [bacterium BMS3Abin04]